MLLVCSHGRGALDMRLLGQGSTAPGKIEAAADKITEIWREHRDHAYYDTGPGASYPGPNADPARGALQIVFCDLGTPSGKGWNAYDGLRDQLAARGMPRDAIRFIHEAGDDDRKKADLFEDCRNGNVAVLVGSTAKMGVGTNVQKRAVALHHLDAPWRPADIAQREGRILRQGNRNEEVRIFRYVTRSTFDAYMWQLLERKAKFIAQVLRGKLDIREIDDIGDAALSFSEVKALAAGNPLLIDKHQADAELTRLERKARDHVRAQDRLRRTADSSARLAEHIKGTLIPQAEAAIARRTDTAGDNFTMAVAGVAYGKRKDAGGQLKDLLAKNARWLQANKGSELTAGQLGGHEVVVSYAACCSWTSGSGTSPATGSGSARERPPRSARWASSSGWRTG